MPDVNQIHRETPSFLTQGDAASISSRAMEVYELGVSHFAKHLANAYSQGYMHDVQCHLTQGPHGEDVRAVEMNHFSVEARGPISVTERPLDIAIRGPGFLTVDGSGSTEESTKILCGAKVSGSFQMDDNGYLYDEGGNILLGKEVNPDGKTINPCSVLTDLDRVKLDLMPDQAKASENIEFAGVLPADNISPGDTRDSAVDVYDSLGVAHQLRFVWKFLAPRVWQITAQDSVNTPLFQDVAGGAAWQDTLDANGNLQTRGGAIITFTEDGAYDGSLAATEVTYIPYDDALRDYTAAKTISDFVSKTVAENPAITKADLITQATNFANITYPVGVPPTLEHTEAQVAIAAMTAAGPLATDAETAAVTETGAKRTDMDNAWTALSPSFSPQKMPPSVYAQGWLNSAGALVGSADSTIALDPSDYKLSGDQYQVRTPEQDGRGSSAFKGVSVSDGGLISYEFFGQQPKPAWQLFLVNFTNNNAMVQEFGNILIPNDRCGPYVLDTPLNNNLGASQAKCIVESNVNQQEAMLGSQRMSIVTQANTTVYKIAIDLDKFIMNMIAQSA